MSTDTQGISDEQIAAAVRQLYADDTAASMGLADDIRTARAVLALQPEAATLPAEKEPAGRTMADLKRAISGAIGFQWERGELQEVNADDLINVAIAVLSIKKEECNGL